MNIPMRMKAILIGRGRWGKILAPYIANKFDLTNIYGKDNPFKTSADVVFVATPYDAHYEIVKHYIKQGKHIFCEKPLTIHADECMELKELAEKNDVILYTDYLEMSAPSRTMMASLLNNIGNIIFVEGISFKYQNHNKIPVIWALYPHLLSILSLCVDINSLTFYQEGKMIYGYNGIIASLMADIKSDVMRKQFIITGDKGILWWDAYAYNTLFLCNDIQKVWHFNEKNNISYSINQFIKVIEGEGNNNIDTAISITKICEAIASKGYCVSEIVDDKQ